MRVKGNPTESDNYDKISKFVRQHSLTREVYLLPDLLPAGDVGAALVDAEVGLADVSKK